jgi:hypothetical protein
MINLKKIEEIEEITRNVEKELTLLPGTISVVWEDEPNELIKEYSEKIERWSGIVLDGRIMINAKYSHRDEVRPIIFHEIGHLIYENKKVKKALERLYKSLSKEEKKELRDEVKKQYPSEDHREEIRVRCLEMVISSYGPKKKNLWDNLLIEIDDAWKKIKEEWNSLMSKFFGIKPDKSKELLSLKDYEEILKTIVEEGTKKMKEIEKMEELKADEEIGYKP